MSKKAAVQTEANKAVLDARQKREIAAKHHAEKPTDNTAKALAAADNTLKAAIAVENRERFVRVAGGRVTKALIAIRNLANVAAPRSYTYTEDDIAKAENVLNSEVKTTIGKLRSALSSNGKSAKAVNDFVF